VALRVQEDRAREEPDRHEAPRGMRKCTTVTTAWELFTRVSTITGAVSIAMRPFMILIIWHASSRRAAGLWPGDAHGH
jgi:hypothetical protein